MNFSNFEIKQDLITQILFMTIIKFSVKDSILLNLGQIIHVNHLYVRVGVIIINQIGHISVRGKTVKVVISVNN